MTTLGMGGALLAGGTVEWWTPPEYRCGLGLAVRLPEEGSW